MAKLRLLGSLAVTVKEPRCSGRSELSMKMTEVGKDAVCEQNGDNPLDLTGEDSREEHKKHDN